MKNVTEFPNFKLLEGLKTKAALVAEGKTPEEIIAKWAEAFKLEGDKLKHFANCIEVAGQNTEKLIRVLVVSLNEGENPPAKALKVEEHYYVPEFQAPPKPAADPKDAKAAGGKGAGRRGGGGPRDNKPKGSPWGISPEEKAAKKAAGQKAAKAAKPT